MVATVRKMLDRHVPFLFLFSHSFPLIFLRNYYKFWIFPELFQGTSVLSSADCITAISDAPTSFQYGIGLPV
jgi:hypothetical protein